MIAALPDLIDQTTLEKVRNILSQSSFVDGQHSAGSIASSDKNNQELDINSTSYAKLNELLMGALVNHPQFKAICWPAKTASPIYARYESGMFYGRHIDNPVMGQSELYRSDISFTLFLSNPDAYQGGELAIIDQSGERLFKLNAGSVLFYPSSHLHEVKPVTQGERFVAVSWLQSRIRNAEQRQILYDLFMAREMLNDTPANRHAYRKVDSSFNNLIRLWIDI